MSDTKSQLIVFAFSLVPYALVSWGYTELTNGNIQTFWIAIGTLFGVRFFFSIIETIGGVLTWRLYGRKVMIEKALLLFRSNKFPMREYKHDDLEYQYEGLLGYLARIEDNGEISPSIKRVAKDLETMLTMWENQGILVGARMYSATEAALDIYAPKRLAKEFPWGQ